MALEKVAKLSKKSLGNVHDFKKNFGDVHKFN